MTRLSASHPFHALPGGGTPLSAGDGPFTVRRARSHVAVLAVAVLAVGLSACGSKPARVSDGGAGASAPVAASSGRGGGYYLDDGPGDYIPPNLDAIPDAVPRIEPLHGPALRPYTVMGQSFVPRTELTPYRERGHASWYGRRFHGNPTSIGEPYDMFAMTAAHPTLPIPSYVRVTNLQNGRTVIVRVNDRGPFLRGRLIDLSYAAAHRLGYVNAGSAMVEVESILPDEIRMMASGQTSPVPVAQGGSAAQPQVVQASPLPPLAMPAPAPVPVQVPIQAPVASSPVTAGGAFVQLGAFSTAANAQDMAGRVRTELGMFADRLHLLSDGGRYRLQVGPFASADEARIEAGRIGALLNLQPFVVFR